MEIQPITDGNIDAVWELYQRTAAECDMVPLDWFKFKILGDPDPDPCLTLAAVESGHPIAFMAAVCRQTGDGPIGFVKVWGTDRSQQGRGIASVLLERIEGRFRELGVGRIGVGYSRPNYITPGIDASAYTPAVGFLLRRGFKYVRMNYNMDVPLAGRKFSEPEAERSLAERGVIIRRVESDERERFSSWVEGDWSAGWRYQADTACDADPPAAFAAEKDGKFVGFAVYDGVRPGWFGPTGTSEALRGFGIGSALFLKCLDDMQDKGYPICHICAVSPLYFYSKVIGATVSRTFWLMEKTLDCS